MTKENRNLEKQVIDRLDNACVVHCKVGEETSDNKVYSRILIRAIGWRDFDSIIQFRSLQPSPDFKITYENTGLEFIIKIADIT